MQQSANRLMHRSQFVIQQMLRLLTSIPHIYVSNILILVVGCSPSVPTSTSSQAPKLAHLADIGEPDEDQRRVDGILVIGSALTDDHVVAIRALTDSLEPPVQQSGITHIRNICHDAPNAATNIWQVGTLQVYQKLVLRDGKWAIDEEGGGFVHGH